MRVIPAYPRLPRGPFVKIPTLMGEYRPIIDESDRQMLCNLLAEGSLKYPGWADYLKRIAAKLPNGGLMYDDFMRIESK